MRDSVDERMALWQRELPDLDQLKEQIISRISIVNKAVSEGRSESLDSNELAYWQFKTLLMLRRQGPPYELSPSELADILGLTRGALSARLAGLEQRDLVVREHDLGDRRRVTVRLTDSGHRAVETQLGDEDAREQRIIASLTGREKQVLASLLRKLVIEIES